MSNAKSLGILELDGARGFLRRPENSYLPDPDDCRVEAIPVRQYGLRTGDELEGTISGMVVTHIEKVNGHPVTRSSAPGTAGRAVFQRLPVIHPEQQLKIDCGLKRLGKPDLTNRIIDLMVPIGRGQRLLVVSPPKAGKTMVLQAIAEGICKNHKDCKLLILLVDERPEEVSEMKRCGFGEVISSSFDFTPERHSKVAEMTLSRAQRQVESGNDVVIILDSITRLARACNTLDTRSKGRTLSGGLGAAAIEKPKALIAAARKIEHGGSLTVIATALVDTGSRMDQVIFEEFKGTGNAELVLSRDLSDRRIFPAIDLTLSGTRHEERLLSPKALEASTKLRRALGTLRPLDAMENLINAMTKTNHNDQFIEKVLMA